MKRTSKELKALSRDTLLGKYGLVILAYFLVSLIVGAASTPFENMFDNYINNISFNHTTNDFPILALIGVIIIALASIVLYAGISRLHLGLARNEQVSVAMIFSQFRQRPDRFIIYGFVFGILECILFVPGTVLITVSISLLYITKMDIGVVYLICGIALLILGMVFAFFFAIRFCVTQYIMIDNPDLGCFASMKQSFAFTKGNAGRILYLFFSFIPMGLLTGLSFGIASLWTMPYIENTMTWLYLDISGELDHNLEEERRMEEEMGPVLDDSQW